MIAALFPGQGSQSVGMGKFLFDEFKLVRQLFEEAGDNLKINFKKLCFEGPEADLQKTENTQPCLLLVSTACFEVLKENAGFKPFAGAGHSVGEYSALVAARVIRFSDALQAVRIRGQEMQKAVPLGEGGMVAALGITDEQAQVICQIVEQKSGFQPLEPANFNAPGQVVLSGSAKAIDWLIKNASSLETKAKFKNIPVSAPFHCSLMKPAELAMDRFLSGLSFSNAAWPIVQNVTAKETQDSKTIRTNLVAQVSRSVRWTESYLELKKLGMTRSVEVGAGKVLSGLAKRIDSELPPPLNIGSLVELKAAEALISL